MSKYRVTFDYDKDPVCEPEFTNGLPIFKIEGPDCEYPISNGVLEEVEEFNKKEILDILEDIKENIQYEINWDGHIPENMKSKLSDDLLALQHDVYAIIGYQTIYPHDYDQ